MATAHCEFSIEHFFWALATEGIYVTHWISSEAGIGCFRSGIALQGIDVPMPAKMSDMTLSVPACVNGLADDVCTSAVCTAYALEYA